MPTHPHTEGVVDTEGKCCEHGMLLIFPDGVLACWRALGGRETLMKAQGTWAVCVSESEVEMDKKPSKAAAWEQVETTLKQATEVTSAWN